MLERYLLGGQYSNPELSGAEHIGESLGLGLASVVTREQKRHNFTNNEDAVGAYEDDELAVIMVADAHWGRVAAEQAVLRFPYILKRKVGSVVPNEQAYFEAILALGENLVGVGKRLQVQYPSRNGRFNEKLSDASVTQFYSVVKIMDKYYFVGLGDCKAAILRGENVEEIHSKNRGVGDLGSLTPRNYMKLAPWLLIPGKDEQLRYDNNISRIGVDVQELHVKQGDVVFMCTDGYVWDHGLPTYFQGKTIREGVNDIMKDVMDKRDNYSDNVGIAAMRVA